MSAQLLDKRLAAHLTWQEFAQRVKENYIFILTIGAIEQHGLHMPIGYDYMMGHEIALELAVRSPAVVMPTLTYGYRSQAIVGGGDQFPGTVCIGGEALIFTVRDILEELIRHGVRRILVQNSHIENHHFLTDGIELCRKNADLEKLGCKILLAGWGYFAKDETLDALFEGGKFPGWDPEHAAVIETSTMLASRPEYVDIDKLPDEVAPRYPKYSVFPTPPDVVTKNGALAPATGASAEKGHMVLRDVFEGYAEAFKHEFGV